MPDQLKNYHGDTDWVKIIMALATASLFVLQGIGFKMHSTTKKQGRLKPFIEVMQKDDLVLILKTINDRLDAMEKQSIKD